MTPKAALGQPVYFCDRNLGKGFPQRLRELGLEIKAHDELFSPDTPDEEWIPQVSAQGWVILTLDAQLRYRPVERAILRSFGARVILFTQPKQPERGWLLLLAEEFAQAQGKVTGFLKQNSAPFVVRFSVDPKKRGSRRYQLFPLKL
ncbi:hypothetical protein TCCBUS3UF1_570 [Thermus sp. CCB_US3_UF1]|uniref:PIN-like domain-containing protein n=1 Tax=Thermus sp. CCB_US3_UF1 TaxID=1111069 RepID=UPI000238A2B0|nr:hypothetical protein [Thermus sp. CCB_US3_UF1]AEV15107.1 hypothetical protein TCCBUS3UF1_570 [Thermus sp. CCB_US3_UF1]